MRTRVVIGLMGGDESLDAAAQIGAVVAEAGEILTTGAPIGTPNSTRIHQVAMRGGIAARYRTANRNSCS